MKKYIIIAGVNGAGKPTLYEALDELNVFILKIFNLVFKHCVVRS